VNAPTPDRALQKVPFKNVGADEVPPCGMMHVTGSIVEDEVTFLMCAKPGSTFSPECATNGLVRVASGQKGVCYRQGNLPVAYDAGPPQAGEGWGPKPNQFMLSKGFPGFTVIGVVDAANKIALVSLD